MTALSCCAPKQCNKALKPNPFQAYRNPETGLWVILKPSVSHLPSGHEESA